MAHQCSPPPIPTCIPLYPSLLLSPLSRPPRFLPPPLSSPLSVLPCRPYSSLPLIVHIDFCMSPKTVKIHLSPKSRFLQSSCTPPPLSSSLPPRPPTSTPSSPPSPFPHSRSLSVPPLPKKPPLPASLLLQFERKGHVALREILTPSEMADVARGIVNVAEDHLLEAYRHRVGVLCPKIDPKIVKSVQMAKSVLRKHATEEVGFLQIFNLHRYNEAARQLALSPRLSFSAAQLLGCKRVRVYQDCLFVKAAGLAATNWHADLSMVPLDTSAFLTFWLPLRHLAAHDSTLLFASGSHRDFSLPYWHTEEGMADLSGRGYPLESYQNLQLGDATVHHGWTLHWAPSQPKNLASRMAFTISYFADGAQLLNSRFLRRKVHSEDQSSFCAWLQNAKEGTPVDDPLLPLAWPQSR